MSDPQERIRRYLLSRADVPIPRDLRWPTTADEGRPRTALSSFMRWAGAAAVVIVAAVAIAAVVVNTPAPVGTETRPTGTPATASPGPSGTVAAEFPSTVADMPVVSVAEAVDLVRRGDLDGRVVAVAGYYFAAAVRCPAPQRYIGPLEQYCGFVAFTDDPARAKLCVTAGNSTSCHPPSGTYLAPHFVPETTGALPAVFAQAPTPLVLVGHAGDARHWQCAGNAREGCRLAFVVDRIAWAGGREVTLTAPEAWDRTTWKPLAPRRTLDEVTSAVGGGKVLAAAAFRAGEVSTIDPRWNLGGTDIVWVVRSFGEGRSDEDPTRSVVVSLVNDATGELVDRHDLALDPGYEPARLWVGASARGIACCAGNVYPFYGVETVDGAVLHDGMVAGGAYGRETETTYAPGVPLILRTGTYRVSAWMATLDGGVIGPPGDECSTEITLSELDDVMLEAEFPAVGGACSFGPPTAPRLTF